MTSNPGHLTPISPDQAGQTGALPGASLYSNARRVAPRAGQAHLETDAPARFARAVRLTPADTVSGDRSEQLRAQCDGTRTDCCMFAETERAA